MSMKWNISQTQRNEALHATCYNADDSQKSCNEISHRMAYII